MLFNEPKLLKCVIARVRVTGTLGFSALQRAEIAEIFWSTSSGDGSSTVSVLFNEPKLLKFGLPYERLIAQTGFSALQRAEIAEIALNRTLAAHAARFQCSSTSRNC